jgi:hypothetical protein
MNQFAYTPPASAWAPTLNLAEREFHIPMAKIEDRIFYHCDRPDIEVRILNFIARAHGPDTRGIAAAMGISEAAADVHLRELRAARRIWGQRIRADEMSWHVSQEGKRFLAGKGNHATQT